jgi:hypothetical protein
MTQTKPPPENPGRFNRQLLLHRPMPPAGNPPDHLDPTAHTTTRLTSPFLAAQIRHQHTPHQRVANSAARPARARRPSDRAYVSAIITSNIFPPSRSPILILIMASSHPDRRATFGCDLTHGRLQKRKFQKSLRSPGHLSLQINAHVKILWDCQRANTAYRHQRHRQL